MQKSGLENRYFIDTHIHGTVCNILIDLSNFHGEEMLLKYIFELRIPSS